MSIDSDFDAEWKEEVASTLKSCGSMIVRDV